MDHNIETEKRICELYIHGTEASEISKEFKTSRNVILRILTRHNIPRHRDAQRMGVQNSIMFKNITTKHESEICDMYVKKRICANKIAEHFKVPAGRILDVLKRNNIQLRTHSEAIRTEFTPEIESKICKMYIERINPEKIAIELNISQHLIPRILKENDIKIRGLYETTSHITLEIEKEICETYRKEELSLFRLGKKFGVSEGFIRRIITKNNMQFRPHGIVTEEGKKCIIKSNNKRCGELSATFGRIPSKDHCWGNGAWYDTPLQGTIWIRSGWEIRYAIFLDEHNILWTYETIAFPLTLNNRRTTYRPDFYLIDYDIYIDVKGRDEWNKEKIKSFQEQYSEIKLQILSGKDLANFGINVRKPIYINNKWRI